MVEISSDSDDDRRLAAPDTQRWDDKGKRQQISESEPRPDDSGKEKGRLLRYRRMNRAPKMDDKEKRQQIPESEPRSNDSSKKGSSSRSNDSSKKESSPRSNDSSMEESSPHWSHWILSWICYMLLFQSICLVVLFCNLVFWLTLDSAWYHMMKWAERQL